MEYLPLEYGMKKEKDFFMPDAELSTQAVLERLKEQKIEIENEIIELSKRYKAKHPRMIALQTRLQAIRDSMENETKKLLEMNPNFYVAYYWLAFPYVFKGMHDKAVATVEKAMAMSGGGPPLMWTVFGFIQSVAGKNKEAEKALVKMREQSKQTYVAPWMMAIVYAGFGEKDKAFELLDKSYKERDHWLIYTKVSPAMDNLRSDPRFKALLKKAGLE